MCLCGFNKHTFVHALMAPFAQVNSLKRCQAERRIKISLTDIQNSKFTKPLWKK